MKPVLSTWLQASRLPSQLYILLPLLLGQIIWLQQNGSWDWGVFILIHIFGLFDQLYIVYANDCMDFDVDRNNTTYNIFSGGSRVLVENKLSSHTLGRAALYAALTCLAVSLILALVYGRSWSPLFAAAALLLLWMYSFPPIKLSYRGGGEFLQMIGVGALLPVFAYYAQAGSFERFPWLLLAPLLPVQLGCAMSTALPDQPSDKSGGKHTFAVLLSPERTRILVGLLHLSGLTLFISMLEADSFFEWRYLCSALLMLLPATMLLILKGKPGTRRMNQFVSVSVLFTLAFVVLLMFFR